MLLQVKRPLARTFITVAVSGLLGLTLLSAAASRIQAQPATRGAAPRPTILHAETHFGALRSGSVDITKLPIMTPSNAPSTGRSPSVPLTPQLVSKQNAYDTYMRAHPSALPQASGMAAPKPGANFVGGKAIPYLTGSAEGLNSTSAGGSAPDAAIATAPGYVMEATDNTLVVYSSSFAIKYGPISASSFFAPIAPSGGSFSKPQVVYDAERAVYLIAWLGGCANNTMDCVDLAISKTSTLALTNFYEYQVPISSDLNMQCATNAGTLTIGYDYWGMYLTCPTYNQVSYGNQVFAFSLNNLLSGAIGTYRTWPNVPSAVSCGTSCYNPATLVSASIEDGVQQAEWFVATDQGYSVTSSSLTLCALTNTHALPTATSPTLSCIYQTLPHSYADALQPAQPLARHAYMPAGAQQMEYRGGRLYFGLTTALSCSGTTEDGLLWASIVPQLSTLAAHNPQQVTGLDSISTNSAYWCITNTDSFLPAVAPSAEGDVALVFDYSSATISPSVAYTGRMAADAPGTMGQGASYAVVVSGSNDILTVFLTNSVCSLDPNTVTRGTLYCASQFGGPNSGSGWDTELLALRME